MLPQSLRDLVAQAAVSDHFQLDLRFAPRAPWGERGWRCTTSQVSAARLRDERSHANLDALREVGRVAQAANSERLIKISFRR